ncbi:Uncharacterised protein [Mycobacteroides abscessus subsp. abscessus]|nr:Uncharacterised protein [Mycobacteroides abscessus subsp. abscessus]
MATWELNPANSFVKIPNGVRSCSGSPPVEPWNVPGMRSAARLRIAAGVKFCSFSARVSTVSAPTGRLDTPPGVVTAAPPGLPWVCAWGTWARWRSSPHADRLRCVGAARAA